MAPQPRRLHSSAHSCPISAVGLSNCPGVQPPHDSSSVIVSMHSYPAERATLHGVRPKGHKLTLRAAAEGGAGGGGQDVELVGAAVAGVEGAGGRNRATSTSILVARGVGLDGDGCVGAAGREASVDGGGE